MERQDELCTEVKQRAPTFLESGQWTDCKFVVGAEPHQVVVGGYKLVMAMASPVFEAMFYGGLAEIRDYIHIVDVEPEIFKAMLRYIYTNKVKLVSCDEAMKLYYTANKYMLHHLKNECSNYLLKYVNIGNVLQLYENSQLFEDEVLTQKCINIFTEKTKELLQDSSFKDADLTTVETIFSLKELNIDSEVDLINAAALYASAQDDKFVEKKLTGLRICTSPQENVMNVENNETQNSTDGPEQATPGSSHLINDTVNKQQIRSVVNHIRFLTLTPQQYTDCAARFSLLTTSEDYAVILNIIDSKNPNVPMPSGLSTSRISRVKVMPSGLSTSSISRDKVDKARSEATFRYTVQNISSLEGDEYSPMFYVRNLPWRIVARPGVYGGIKYLYLIVECNAESESTDWSCRADIECKLICHKPGAEDLVKRELWVFRRYGITPWCNLAVRWDTVLDPTNSYIQNDAITVEVHIRADEPRGVI